MNARSPKFNQPFIKPSTQAALSMDSAVKKPLAPKVVASLPLAINSSRLEPTPRLMSRRVALSSQFQAVFGKALARATKNTFSVVTTTVVIILLILPGLTAFEAHVVNVVATPVLIDPPTLTPPGNNNPNDTNGGTNLTGTVNVDMSDPDPDATKVFYNVGPGTNPNAVTNPTCSGPFGGAKTPDQQTAFTSNSVVKAIACDNLGHFSAINTKIYTFAPPPVAGPSLLLLNPETDTPPDNQTPLDNSAPANQTDQIPPPGDTGQSQDGLPPNQ